MDTFNETVRRIANLRAYGMDAEQVTMHVQGTGTELRLLVVAADMFLSYAPFDMPERTEPTSPVSGEFTAR
jgi:hypothetical protein